MSTQLRGSLDDLVPGQAVLLACVGLDEETGAPNVVWLVARAVTVGRDCLRFTNVVTGRDIVVREKDKAAFTVYESINDAAEDSEVSCQEEKE